MFRLPASFHTRSTKALLCCDERIEIFLAVIVGDLFACFDAFCGIDVDAVFSDANLSIRSTGVIHVARNVLAGTAKDRFVVLEIKEVASANGIRNLARNKLSPIFDNKPFCRDVLDGKNPKPRHTPTKAKRKDGRAREGMRHNVESIHDQKAMLRSWWFL